MTFQKRNIFSKKRILQFTLLCLIAIITIPFYVKFTVKNSVFSDINNVQKSEFAIVLGAAIINNTRPGSYLKHRLDDVLALFKAGKIQKILISGDNGKDAHDEISVMNNYLIQNGVPQNIIYGDYAGFDTYSTMERAEKIFEIKNAIIVSQGFHLPRAIYIARQKGIQATGYATIQSYGRRKYFIREYLATIKSYFDCVLNRKSKYYGKIIDTNEGSNIEIIQLK